MELTPRRILAARVVSVVADALQLGLFPLFAPGALSWADDVLDVVVGALLTALVGWHWAFLPAFMAELVPVFDLVPSWTLAVFVATRQPADAPAPPAGPASPGALHP